nr:MAG TPA: hypothetical protein [Caudoviricetes sp.]
MSTHTAIKFLDKHYGRYSVLTACSSLTFSCE